MSEGRNIYLVTMTTHGLGQSHRAFETIDEAKEHVDTEVKSFARIAEVGDENFIAGATFEIRPLRLGRYEDGS